MHNDQTRRFDIAARVVMAALVLMLTGCSWSGGRSAPALVHEGYLTDREGRALYTYDRDRLLPSESLCAAACAQLFPPYIVPESARRTDDYRWVRRSDGTRQWTLHGHPLYRYSGDRSPGQLAGDGYDNLFRLARP